jgi:antitoxin MazE
VHYSLSQKGQLEEVGYRQCVYGGIAMYHGGNQMKARMVKWGNSLAVRIPKHIAAQARLKQGDSLEIEAAGEGLVELRRTTRIPTLSQLVSQITPENRYPDISSGVEVGAEIVEW